MSRGKSNSNKHNQGHSTPLKPRYACVLKEILERLYTLRNQILHGGTTFATGKGREQLKDGSEIMAALVPVILEIMHADIEQKPGTNVWGRVAYPLHNFKETTT